MYQIQFTATSSAGWSEAIEMIDANTNQFLEIADTDTFEIDVRDACGGQMLEASTANGKIELPSPGVIQWRFSRDEVGGLCPGTTYKVGGVVTTLAGPTQLFIGTLAYLNGEVA